MGYMMILTFNRLIQTIMSAANTTQASYSLPLSYCKRKQIAIEMIRP